MMRRIGVIIVLAAATLSQLGCGKGGGAAMPAKATVTRAPFGTTPDGKPVEIFTLTNTHGMEVRAMTYGGIIVSIKVADNNGTFDDVVLGYDSLAGYVKSSPYFGAIVGRYGNRIAKGHFTLDGKIYTLAVNNVPNALHGGLKGFDKVVWTGEPFQHSDTVGIALTYVSADGEEGYPGTLNAKVTYALTPENQLVVTYDATTDKPTPVNLTQHSYFNLAGAGKGDILKHKVMIKADTYTPVDSTLIPTGKIESVYGTPFDFRTVRIIGAHINDDDPQIKNGGGYDHNFVLTRTGPDLALAARVDEPTTGRELQVFTTEPGVQFYTGNFLDGTNVGKGGAAYTKRTGFCLETQHFPDSPNHDNFPSTIVTPDKPYHSQTVFAFGVKE